MNTPTKKARKILVTQALPYANAPLHLGHILEAVQTDIWARFQNLNGNECLFFCADDTHGTPVMLKAKEMNITPEELIEQVYEDHRSTYGLYGINFTNFYTTHSDENKKYSEKIYLEDKKNNLISKEIVEQLYDEQEEMFLSDRFIKGSCPKCGEPDQYGDNCSKCGACYDVLEIKAAKQPVKKAIKKSSKKNTKQSEDSTQKQLVTISIIKNMSLNGVKLLKDTVMEVSSADAGKLVAENKARIVE